MSIPAAPRRISPRPGQWAGFGVLLILLLIGLGQCGSAAENNSTSNPAETSVTKPPATEPTVADGPATPLPGPSYELPPDPEPVPAYEPAPVYEPAPSYGEDDSSGGSVYYKNCSAARAAGVTPLHVGDPGYASHLDRDGDGVACE